MSEVNCYCYPHPIGSDFDKWETGTHDIQLSISASKKRALSQLPRGEEHQQESVVAFDHLSRKYYAIRHFPCCIDSWHCCCAAQAQEVSGPGAKVLWEPVAFPDLDEDEKEDEE